jgi:ABC-type transport system involved in cytochrome c biogenesis permease subunit
MAWTRILDAYARDNAPDFKLALVEYQQQLAASENLDLNERKVSYEVFLNRFSPFSNAAAFYVIAFVLTAAAWLFSSKGTMRAAYWLILATFVLHTFALASRIYISGRPPVTNLYSSAVFIGWGGVILGLGLEAVYRIGIGNLVASVCGFCTLVIAHFLAARGDTFTVLQAVLDTQFWLATHVVCVSLGYAVTFVAGILGIVYILGAFATKSVDKDSRAMLSRMIYGTVCFALFFSFFGTVLGGLWADDSWGRFWGWDPKENGALIIVLWNALILHARWGGMIGSRGLAVLAVLGNITTGWSWFGVNELGIGLHSYGFTEGVLLYLGLFVFSQIAVATIGLMPLRFWRSYTR